jgi:hypothetical protein
MAAMRDDLGSWLAEPAQKALRDWVMTPDASAVTNDAVQSQPPGRSVSSDGPPGIGQSGIAHGSPHLSLPTDNAVSGAVSVSVV